MSTNAATITNNPNYNLSFNETFEKVYENIPGNGWLSKPEARLLWDVCSKCSGDILEVGCYQGRSTIVLASFGRIVHAVDQFNGFHSELTGNEIYSMLLDNLHGRSITNVIVHKYPIEKFNPISVGLAYLDGDHTYKGTIQQIQKALACFPMTIAVHDVNDSGGGLQVKQACLELLGEWDIRVERLAVWYMWIPKATSPSPSL